MMVYVYALVGIILSILGLMLLIAYIVHRSIFHKRYENDPLVKGYTTEEFNINKKPIKVKCKRYTECGYIYNGDLRTKSPLVVFMHGMFSSIEAYNQEICYLAKNGYEVIALNNIGVDTSQGDELLGLGASLLTLDNLLNKIEGYEKFQNRDIYLVGHSWGAYAISNICKLHPNVKKLVALAPFRSINALLKGMLPKIAYPLIPFLLFIDYLKCGKYSLFNSLDSLKVFKGKALILHSTNDPMVNYTYNTKPLIDNLNNIEFMISNDKFHNPDYSKEAIAYLNEYQAKLKSTKNINLINEYKSNTDFRKMGELDNEVMNKIIEFLDK